MRLGPMLFGFVIVMIMLNKKVQFGHHFLVVLCRNMHILQKILFLIFVITLTASCRLFTEAHTSYASWLRIKPPDGTPVFKKGFVDGCSQIFYSRGNMFYRMRYSYHYDTKLHENREYRFGFKRGASFCFNSVIQPTTGFHGSPDRALFPYKTDGFAYDGSFGMGTQNYNTTGGGLFDGLNAPLNPVSSNNPGGFDAIFNLLSGGVGNSVFTANPIWAGGSKGQIFGQE